VNAVAARKNEFELRLYCGNGLQPFCIIGVGLRDVGLIGAGLALLATPLHAGTGEIHAVGRTGYPACFRCGEKFWHAPRTVVCIVCGSVDKDEELCSAGGGPTN